MISEKALMDLYIQQLLERGEALKRQAGAILERGESSRKPAAELAEALKALDQPLATDSMKALMEEAKQRGEEANRVGGYREPVVFLVDQFDLTEVGWWKQVLQRAVASGDDRRMRNAARMVLHYADPGKGGFYELAGVAERSAAPGKRRMAMGIHAFRGAGQALALQCCLHVLRAARSGVEVRSSRSGGAVRRAPLDRRA